MLVSVIIPTFNRKELLKRALKSVFQQSYINFEVIVVDDGSFDNTAAMIAEDFPQVRYFFQANHGVSSARNKGLEHANGEWIAFLDSDDEWLLGKLEKQLALLNRNRDIRVCHTEEIWIRHGVRVNQMKKHQKYGGWIFPKCLPLCAMSPSSIVIHRSVFDDVGYFDQSLPACEDYDLWLKITAKYPVLYLDEPQIVKYGGHEDQLSGQHWGMDRFRIQALENIIKSKVLSDDNKHQAIAMLLKKCKLFQQGALKRGKVVEAERYQKIIDDYQV